MREAIDSIHELPPLRLAHLRRILDATPRIRGRILVRCHLPDRETKLLADRFLQEAVARLAKLSFSELSSWPEWPAVPDSGVVVPEQLAAYAYTVMKDSQPDGSIRVAIQRYRNIFGPLGEMVAEGFFIHPNGEIVWMAESDKWEVT